MKKKKQNNQNKFKFQSQSKDHLNEGKTNAHYCNNNSKQNRRTICFQNNKNDSMKKMALRAAKKEWRENKFLKEFKVIMMDGKTYTFFSSMWTGKNQNGKNYFRS